MELASRPVAVINLHNWEMLKRTIHKTGQFKDALQIMFFLCFVCVNALDLLHVALCGAVDSGAALRPSLGSESKVSRPGPAPAVLQPAWPQRVENTAAWRNSKAAIPICSMVLEYFPTFARTKSTKCR